jgi:hypothetical protein
MLPPDILLLDIAAPLIVTPVKFACPEPLIDQFLLPSPAESP